MDVTAVPLGDLIATIGRNVADAQQTIDTTVLDHFAAIYDMSVDAFEPLRAAGYQPTWYQIAEASAEITLALTVSAAQATASAPSREVRAAPVDAAYRSTFTYALKRASSLKFRIVPVPPPSRAEREVPAPAAPGEDAPPVE